jgi:hypothetical protein
VRQIIIPPLLQFDTHILLAKAKTRKNPTKNLPIKAILTIQMFEGKQQTILIKNKEKKQLDRA